MADIKPFGFGNLPGTLGKKWPKDEKGEPVAPVFLAHLQSADMADAVFVNMLEAYGIPAIQVYPGDGTFGKIVMGLSGMGSDILVPENYYEDAKALMEERNDDE